MPDPDKFLIVANYRSGLGWYKGVRVALAARRLRRMLRRRGKEHRLIVPKKGERIEDIVERELGDRGVIVGIFGDGSIRGLANGLARIGALDRVFLPLPYGTANDFCQELGLTSNVRKAFHRLNNTSLVDLGTITHNGETGLFVSTAGVGLPAMVARVIRDSRRGAHGNLPRYFMRSLQTFFRDHAPAQLTITAECDGRRRTVSGRFHAVIIGNTGQYAGHFRLFPRASLTDGRLDVCVVRAQRKSRLALKFPLVYFGLHTHASGIDAFQCTHLHIEGKAELEIDGDYYGMASSVQLGIAEERLTVGGLPPAR